MADNLVTEYCMDEKNIEQFDILGKYGGLHTLHTPHTATTHHTHTPHTHPTTPTQDNQQTSKQQTSNKLRQTTEGLGTCQTEKGPSSATNMNNLRILGIQALTCPVVGEF